MPTADGFDFALNRSAGTERDKAGARVEPASGDRASWRMGATGPRCWVGGLGYGLFRGDCALDLGSLLSIPVRAGPRGQTSSPRLACFAAARFSVRRSLSVFCAGFFPSFLGFCEPFTCIPSSSLTALVGRNAKASAGESMLYPRTPSIARIACACPSGTRSRGRPRPDVVVATTASLTCRALTRLYH